MSFYRDRIYPVLVNQLGNPTPIQQLRQQVIPLAWGTVLEIGVGSGANFPYYDAGRVERLYALEPNPGMVRLADAERRRTRLALEFLTLPGEQIPLEDASVDTVVSTFTLCTMSAPEKALGGIARVLKPGGVLIFIEHSLAADPRVQRWQRWWEPAHQRMFQGLRLTRDIPLVIARAGLRIDSVERIFLSRFPKSWTHCCSGTASRV